MEIEPDQSFQREVRFADAVVRPVEVAVERQQQRHGVLRHGVGGVGRNARHGEAEFLRRDEIDVVKPGATEENEPDALPGQRGQRGAVENVVDENADRLASGGELRGGMVHPGAEETEVVAKPEVFLFQRGAVEFTGIENGDDHGGKVWPTLAMIWRVKSSCSV